jgi:small redox-active disulfide protein 2
MEDPSMTLIQILGTGCPKCRMLTEHAEQAAQAIGLEYRLEKVTDLNAIIAFGVMTTPALAVDGTVKIAGRVPSVEALKELLA